MEARALPGESLCLLLHAVTAVSDHSSGGEREGGLNVVCGGLPFPSLCYGGTLHFLLLNGAADIPWGQLVEWTVLRAGH